MTGPFLSIDSVATDTLVLHVDSRYRNQNRYMNSGTFSIDLDPILQNVSAIRLSSVELPNIFYTFTKKKKNNAVSIENTDIEIPEGNYTADTLVCALQDALDTFFEKGLYEVSFSTVNGRVTIANTKNFLFKLSESPAYMEKQSERDDSSAIAPPSLLHALGFRKKIYQRGSKYVSESVIDVVGPNYLIMKVNDFGSLRYRQYGVSNAFAKVILTNPKATGTFENYANFVTKQHDFHQPVNLPRLSVELLDPYEQVIDMVGLDWSMTFEVLCVRSSFVKQQLEQDLMWKNQGLEEGFMGMIGSSETDEEEEEEEGDNGHEK